MSKNLQLQIKRVQEKTNQLDVFISAYKMVEENLLLLQDLDVNDQVALKDIMSNIITYNKKQKEYLNIWAKKDYYRQI